ncbi:hypothetical protein C8R44DRAFT_723985 [Mycena epipterygia]|nr:hypothetical protein C8R44DRAFT_723985 [Mycena epipterygia]
MVTPTPRIEIVERNEKFFPIFKKALSGTDHENFRKAATKLGNWLKHEKAYYPEARKQIVDVLLKAEETLRVSAGLGAHPLTNAYTELILNIKPFQHCFKEPELEVSVRKLLAGVEPSAKTTAAPRVPAPHMAPSLAPTAWPAIPSSPLPNLVKKQIDGTTETDTAQYLSMDGTGGMPNLPPPAPPPRRTSRVPCSRKLPDGTILIKEYRSLFSRRVGPESSSPPHGPLGTGGISNLPQPDGNDNEYADKFDPANQASRKSKRRNHGRQPQETRNQTAQRRRRTITEVVNELERIVPKGSGETDKVAILWRTVKYIHDLKKSEVRNIEQRRLEKMLMDQAMGDQVQFDEIRRQRAEEELQLLRGNKTVGEGSCKSGTSDEGNTEGDHGPGKRQRTE